LFSFYVNLQYIYAIVQLIDSDWPANVLAGLYFQAHKSQAMSPDVVCAISWVCDYDELWAN